MTAIDVLKEDLHKTLKYIEYLKGLGIDYLESKGSMKFLEQAKADKADVENAIKILEKENNESKSSLEKVIKITQADAEFISNIIKKNVLGLLINGMYSNFPEKKDLLEKEEMANIVGATLTPIIQVLQILSEGSDFSKKNKKE